MDSTSHLATQASIGDDPIKGRRKVRVFAQDSSSSSDEATATEPQAKLNEDSECPVFDFLHLTDSGR